MISTCENNLSIPKMKSSVWATSCESHQEHRKDNWLSGGWRQNSVEFIFYSRNTHLTSWTSSRMIWYAQVRNYKQYNWNVNYFLEKKMTADIHNVPGIISSSYEISNYDSLNQKNCVYLYIYKHRIWSGLLFRSLSDVAWKIPSVRNGDLQIDHFRPTDIASDQSDNNSTRW